MRREIEAGGRMAFMDWARRKSNSLLQFMEKTQSWAFNRLEAIEERQGWVKVLDQSVRNFLEHGMTLHAGNFAYSAFLAIFPLILLAVSIVGFLFNYDPATLQKFIDLLKSSVPDMQVTIPNAVDTMVKWRGVVGVLGLVGLLWSVSRIAYALNRGFGEIWQGERRSLIRKKVLAFVVMLIVMVVGLIGLGVTFASSQLLAWINHQVGPILSGLCFVLGLILSPLATILIFATLYRTIPVKRPGWKEIIWGALTAALILDALEYLLSFYFTRISKTQALFGPLGIVAGIVLWLYFVGIMILLGAEIVGALQQRWATDDSAPVATEESPAAQP